MFLSKEERKNAISAYGCEGFNEIGHYEVGPDTWIYLFEHEDKKYILVVTDYLGDYEFEAFPHLLRYDDGELKKTLFVLQREIPVNNNSVLKKIRANTILFEYTD